MKIKNFHDFVNEEYMGGGSDSQDDPTYANKVFKVRYTALKALSNDKSPDNIKKPHDDHLDGFDIGDRVSGETPTGEQVEGDILVITHGSDGNGLTVKIEVDGRPTLIKASSIKMVNDRGHQDDEEDEETSAGANAFLANAQNSFEPMVPYSE